MLRPKKNPNQQSNNAPVERKRALSGDSLLVRATVGEGNFMRIDHMRQCLSSIKFHIYLISISKFIRGIVFLFRRGKRFIISRGREY